jgi:DNA-binding transcriptional regulator YiaG
MRHAGGPHEKVAFMSKDEVQQSAAGSPGSNGAARVVVRDFQPERGLAVLEFDRKRVRYTREKSAEQVFAMADYLRARRGFSSDQEMAEILGVHRTRLIAWKQGADVPNPQNRMLLSHLAVVVQEVAEFLDPDVIADWLLTEQFTLGSRTPVDALREGRLAEVLQAANAMEHGAYL